MPPKNNFRHQVYSAEAPQSAYKLIDATFPMQPSAAGYDEQLARCGQTIANEVDAIYLIHGTFVGNDALGWVNQIEKQWPDVAQRMRSAGKKIVDVLADDTGNFTDEYAARIASATGKPVRRFDWSGENNHTGRAVAAIELLDQLFQRLPLAPRNLLLCHSHAGNVLALITNLLGSDEFARDKFLRRVQPIFRDDQETQLFQRVSNSLFDASRRDLLELDIVTMGTPIRYGWETGGYRTLIHFVHHVPREGCDDWLSPVPNIKTRQIFDLDGDLIQQFGIAGTNVWPYVLDFPLMRAERRLNRFLQPFKRDGFWNNLQLGMRVHQTGQTLLVQYDDTQGLARQMAGHSVYTQKEWLIFHLCEVAKRV